MYLKNFYVNYPFAPKSFEFPYLYRSLKVKFQALKVPLQLDLYGFTGAREGVANF